MERTMGATPNWLFEDRLASFNDDTFRAELSPRRVAPDGDGFKSVTPEEAYWIEAKFTDDWLANIAKSGAKTKAEKDAVKPSKKAYVFVDIGARHFPKVWKTYELVEDDTHPEGKRFVRVAEFESFDEVLASVPEAA
jgi:hypothetical protein